MDERTTVWAGQTVIGYVAPHYIAEHNITRWLSWRPQDPLERAIGSHQDQAQAEGFLAQLAGVKVPQ
ncbi:hypothetical protein [Actinoplanes sp. CA-252034]|uniref:hypothetical protein n=1 Tax=Actinoplanes sp. CA-252034 TaxID=3239906 RepID=UPI003D951FFB